MTPGGTSEVEGSFLRQQRKEGFGVIKGTTEIRWRNYQSHKVPKVSGALSKVFRGSPLWDRPSDLIRSFITVF